jgi:hypothetical protein
MTGVLNVKIGIIDADIGAEAGVVPDFYACGSDDRRP